MGEAKASTRPPPWSKNSKAVRTQPITSIPSLKLSPSATALALIKEDANNLVKHALTGVVPTYHPTRMELQHWTNVNLVEPHLRVTRIWMLPRDHFVITFAREEGATSTLQQSLFTFRNHMLYLLPWRPQFNPSQSTGIRIRIWVRFLKLDNLYY